MLTRRTFTGALLAACAAGQARGSETDRAPVLLEDGWPVTTPSTAGLNTGQLRTLVEDMDRGALPNIHAVLLEHKGRLAFEYYRPGPDQRWAAPLGEVDHGPETLHDLRSVTKSVTSALLGIALKEDAEAALTRPITSFFADLDGPFGKGIDAVTLHHVLTMTAGLEWNEMEVPYTDPSNDEVRLYRTAEPEAMVLARDVRTEPGTRWSYNGGLTQLVAGVIERITGQPIDAFAEEVLFGPLGITGHEWLGSAAWAEGKSPSAASGLRLKPRDLAKIAVVFNAGGSWQGQQMVPTDWVRRSTERHVEETPWGPPGMYGYGYFWFPGTTPGGLRMLRAVGNGDQRLFIVPELEMSLTVLAGNYNDFRHSVGDVAFFRMLAISGAE